MATSLKRLFWRFSPFFVFLIFFKFGGGLFYSLIAPLGETLLPLWIVGLLMGGGAAVQVILDVPAGHILDRYGYRRLLKFSTFIFLLIGVCFAFGLTQLTFILSILISTIGWQFFEPGVSAYVLSHAPKEHAGTFISLRDVFGSIGIVLASAVLPFVLLLTPAAIGYVLFILLLIAFVMLFFSPKDHRSVHAEIKIPTQHHYIRRHAFLTTLRVIKKLNPASTMLLLLNLVGASFYGMIWFVVPLVIAHQAQSGLLGIGLGMFDLAIVILGFLLGNLADRMNRRTLIFFGLLTFSVAGLLLGFNFGWLFLLFGFLATAGDEMASVSLWSWLHALDHEHANDGKIAGAISLFEDFGWAVGPIAAGILYTLVGPTWTLVIGATPIFLLWVVFQFMSPKQQKGVPALTLIPAKPHRARHRT